MYQRAFVLLLALLLALLPAAGSGNANSRAGVVIRYADGTVRQSCVSFEQESISGLELLQRVEADVIAQPAPGNAAVCKIGPDGCDYPAESCFCRFGAAGSGEYWAYWQLDGATWRYGQQGAGARRVRNGDVDGWAYGSGSVESGVQPPVVPFAELCPLASLEAEASPSLEAVASPSQPVASVSSQDGAAAGAGAPPATLEASAPAQPAQPAAGGAVSSPGAPAGAQPAGGWGSYLVFGVMLAGVLGCVAFALRRRGAA